MPTYEYQCSACGHAFEKFQSIKAEPIKRCPQCGKARAKRLISTGAGLIFKGSGFYITDYRSEGYKEKAKAESGSGGSGNDGKGEAATGGDSKSAESSKPAEAKPAETKPTETKSRESKSTTAGESRPAARSDSAKAAKKPPKKR